jgi:hypothetical protein
MVIAFDASDGQVSPNPARVWLTVAVPIFLALVIYMPGPQSLFRFDARIPSTSSFAWPQAS